MPRDQSETTLKNALQRKLFYRTDSLCHNCTTQTTTPSPVPSERSAAHSPHVITMKIARSSPTNPFPLDGGRLEPALVKTGDGGEPRARQYSPSVGAVREPPVPLPQAPVSSRRDPAPAKAGGGDPSPPRRGGEAGIHPPVVPRMRGSPPARLRKRTRPRKDGSGNPPPPVVLAYAGAHSPLTREDGSGDPSPSPADSPPPQRRKREPSPGPVVLAYAGNAIPVPHCHPPIAVTSPPLLPSLNEAMYVKNSANDDAPNRHSFARLFCNESPRLKRLISGTNSLLFDFPNESFPRLISQKRMHPLSHIQSLPTPRSFPQDFSLAYAPLRTAMALRRSSIGKKMAIVIAITTATLQNTASRQAW